MQNFSIQYIQNFWKDVFLSIMQRFILKIRLVLQNETFFSLKVSSIYCFSPCEVLSFPAYRKYQFYHPFGWLG